MTISNRIEYHDYKILLSYPETRALVVEGKSDRDILLALRKQFKKKVDNNINCLIFEVGKIDFPSSSGLRFQEVIDLSHRISAESSEVSQRHLGLVDRMYQGFEHEGETEQILDLQGERYVADERLLYTLGHSIENYMFCPNFMLEDASDMRSGLNKLDSSKWKGTILK